MKYFTGAFLMLLAQVAVSESTSCPFDSEIKREELNEDVARWFFEVGDTSLGSRSFVIDGLIQTKVNDYSLVQVFAEIGTGSAKKYSFPIALHIWKSEASTSFAISKDSVKNVEITVEYRKGTCPVDYLLYVGKLPSAE
ncbi:hypothetical protein [Microbulbifer guangxiensis]|uniref:hypothetical protein n=1 Tax=Microbulbifer guangxiensis TaxID=2904249 RepID=UPI001F1F6E04|nr:hypothetical protein [Microbulbifer guangxiensis]